MAFYASRVCLAGTLLACISCAPKVESTTSKVECRSPRSDNKTTIHAWKFEAVRKAIVEVVPREGDGVRMQDVVQEIGSHMPEDDLSELGDLKWFIQTVRLEMEVRGELVRETRAGETYFLCTAEKPEEQ